MKKILLMLALMLPCLGVWAQTPVLTYENITAPQELSAEDAEKIRALNGITIVADVDLTNTSTDNPPSVLFSAVADYTSSSTDNNTIWSLGVGGNQMRYIVGAKKGGWYSRGTISTAAKKLIFTNNNGNDFKFYVDGNIIGELSTSAPKISTFNGEHAKFYLGGVVYNTNTQWGNFNGTINKVEIYEGVLTAEQIAALCYTENDVVFPEHFENGKIYTFKTSLGWMGARDADDKAISTAYTSNNATGSDSDPYFQWSVYKSEEGNYYIYNVGKGKFLGEQSTTGNSAILMTDTPAKVTFKATALGGYPLMFKTTENNSCVVNHSSKYASGLITWNGGWDKTTDSGNCHLITKVDDLDESVLTAIKNAVDAFEADNTEAVAKLRQAITTMETWADTYAGDGLGKYSYQSSEGTFEAKIQEYKDYCDAITQKNNPSPAEVEAKVSEVENLRNSFSINQPETGKFYRLKNNGSSWYATSDVHTSGTYKNKLCMAEAGTTAESVWYLTENNEFISYKEGRYLAGFNGQNDDWSFEAIGASGNVVTFCESGVVSKYQIQPSSGRALYGDKERVDAAGSGNNTGNYAWTIEKVTELPVTITAAGYATFYSPVALTLPKGLEAYAVTTIENGYAMLTNMESIAALDGAILKGAQGDHNLTISTEVISKASSNQLRGSVPAEYVNGVESYVLSAPDGPASVGLYKAQMTDNRFLNNGFKAYLPDPNSDQTGDASLKFRFGGNTTAIESVLNNGADANAPIYDLTGRRVVNAVKGGIYIQNGKKFIVK